jgi:release factor glutamine methyltransferase
MTFQEALEWGRSYLEEKKIPDADIDAWYLLEYLLKSRGMEQVDRTWFLLYRTEKMEESAYRAYRGLIERRGTHVPLQHITGEQEFMGLTFLVNDKVLIPRQDTEILVEEARKIVTAGQAVLDICTGSGCIAISLAKLVPGLLVTACDLSEDALCVARENANRQQVSVKFLQGDLLEPVEGTFDMIVSNPPYIPTGDIEELMEEVRLFDPRMALDGREDGLYFYRKIVAESPSYLKEGGTLLFEIGHDQGEAVAELMRAAGYCEVMVCKDLAGLDRVVKGRRPESRR